MAGGLRYETGRHMPPGMAEKAAVQIARQMAANAPAADPAPLPAAGREMANKKRLIDVKPLMGNGWHLVQTGESNKFLTSMSLADVPTVDAVFVVRCGKCKFAEKDGIHQVSLKCTRFKTGQYTHRVQPDDFCSYGERREGE